MDKVQNIKKRNPIWWLLLLAGIVLMLIGIYALVQPWNAFIYLIKYTGIALVVSSALLILYATMIKSTAGEVKWLVAESIIDLAFAVIFIFNPFLTVIAFPLLIGWWIILRGLIKILLALSLRKLLHGWIIILIVGTISFVFGLLIINYPFERSNGISVTISIFSLLMGSIYVYDAIRFKNTEDTIIAVI